MFTGIVTHLGKLRKRDNAQFTFAVGKSFVNKLEQGTSVSVNGVCVSVCEEPSENSFTVEIMPETALKTMLKDLVLGDIVNLELPMTAKDMFGGHIVQGHVDCVGTLKSIVPEGNSKILRIAVPKDTSRYIVAKGAICVNGISLTVIEAGKDFFTVGIIPYTWEQTMLSEVKEGDGLNIEVDVLAKYMERLLYAKKTNN